MADIEFTMSANNKALVRAATNEALTAALDAVGLQAETYAKINITAAIPRYPSWYKNTGDLRNSISHDADDTTMVVGTNLEYAV